MQKQSVRDVIKQRRVAKGLSAEKLGELVGVAKTTIYRYESGDIAKMPIQVATKMSEILDINPLFFVNMTDNPDSDTPSLIEKTSQLMNGLQEHRQQNVYDYAADQLHQQHNEADETKVTHLSKNSNDTDPDYLMPKAAHIDDDATEEDMVQIKAFMAKIEEEHNKKG